ncbi:MAG: DUF4426 domain-containing protein [Luteimonas sp.]
MRAISVTAAILLAACGAPSPPEGHVNATMEEAVARAGDVSVRASVVPTASLNAAVARQYGIEPDRRSAMLLVGVRQGPEMQETALPARISASTTDLRGARTTIDMREIRSGDFIDYVGTVRVTPPETLRFELEIEHAAGTPARLTFSRDIYPH